jgi:ribosomal protein S18 acetylase RimI-like enzyme
MIGAPWLSQLTCRLLTDSDLPALEWDGEYTHFRRLYWDIYNATLQGNALMWGALLPQVGLVGQVFIQLSSARLELADGKQRAYIYGFRVKRSFRSQGVGRILLCVSEEDLFARHFRIATLNVGIDNPRALQFYENHGYRMVGSDPGRWSYIDHRGVRCQINEPAWRMEKELIQPK